MTARMLAQLARVAARDADALYYAAPTGQRDEAEIARLICVSRTAAYRALELGCVDQSSDALFGGQS